MKIQELYYVPIGTAPVFSSACRVKQPLGIERVNAVSYTHLDVYKRQLKELINTGTPVQKCKDDFISEWGYGVDLFG